MKRAKATPVTRFECLDSHWQTPLQELFAQTQVNHNAQAFILRRQPDFFRLMRYQGRKAFVLGAIEQGELLGAMTVNIDQVFFDGQKRRCAYTADLKVLAAARGRGIGDGLMQYAVQVARAQDPDILILTTVTADNPAGLRKNQKLYPLVHMQSVAALETVFFPCGVSLPQALLQRAPRISPSAFYTAPLDLHSSRDRAQVLSLWQSCSPYRQGQRVYDDLKDPFLPPAQAWIGLFKAQPTPHLVGVLGLWDQRDCRQITLPHQPRYLQQWLYARSQALALWCVVHCVLAPQYRRHFPLLLAAAYRHASQQGGRLLGMALDRADPLSAHLPRWPQQRNVLRLLSSEQPQKAYPFHGELALG